MADLISGSPCVGICRLDADGLCAGCRRSGDEIAAWSGLSPEARDRINRRILPDAHPAVRFQLLGDAGPGTGERRGGRRARRG